MGRRLVRGPALQARCGPLSMTCMDHEAEGWLAVSQCPRAASASSSFASACAQRMVHTVAEWLHLALASKLVEHLPQLRPVGFNASKVSASPISELDFRGQVSLEAARCTRRRRGSGSEFELSAAFARRIRAAAASNPRHVASSLDQDRDSRISFGPNSPCAEQIRRTRGAFNHGARAGSESPPRPQRRPCTARDRTTQELCRAAGDQQLSRSRVRGSAPAQGEFGRLICENP